MAEVQTEQPKKAKKDMYSRPVMTKSLVVNSKASIEALDTYINNTLNNLYRLDVILYFIADENVAEAANEKVRNLLVEKIAYFNEKYKAYNEKAIELDIDLVTYTDSRKKEFEVYSPLAVAYLRLIARFEAVTNLIDTLWLNGEIPSRQRKSRVVKMSQHMRNISSQIRNIRSQADAIVVQQGKQKEVQSKMKELNLDDKDVSEEATAKAAPKAAAPKLTPKAAPKSAIQSDDLELSLSEIIAKEKAEKEAKSA